MHVDLATFMSNVEISDDDCWLWTGPIDRYGYGKLTVHRDGNRHHLIAHRVAYQESVEPIPPGLVIDHLCRVRACVNPDHLEPVTNRVNLLRGKTHAALNAAKTHCGEGHEFTPENTYVDRSGSRECRACRRRRKQDWRRRHATAATQKDHA